MMETKVARQIILDAVRSATAHVKEESTPINRPSPSRSKPGSEPTVKQFREMLDKVGGESYLLETDEQLADRVTVLITEMHPTSMLVTRDEMMESLLQGLGNTATDIVREGDRPFIDAAVCEVGLSRAMAGIANTGTVILQHGSSSGRQAALLPHTHIVIIDRAGIYPDKLGLVRHLSDIGIERETTPMTWVTGPSLTADIEKVLVRGAHGPRRLIALIR